MESTSDLPPSEQNLQLSSISLDTFNSKLVHDPVQYNDNDHISRNNVASWFIRGFAISKGDPDVQYAYIRWSAKQSGLDYLTTLQNFSEAGAGECFSAEEKQLIVSAYNKVKIHEKIDKKTVEDGDSDGPTNPVKMLDFYASEFADESGDAKVYQNSILEDFPNLDILDHLSKAEFMKWADKRYEKTLAIRTLREIKSRKET